MAKKMRAASGKKRAVTATAQKTATMSGGALGDLVGQAESGKASYSAFNRGVVSSRGSMDFSQMTVAEIMALQALDAHDPKRLFAVGKYQLIPSSLKEAVRRLQISGSTMFTPQVQEQIFRNYVLGIKRSQIKAYITAKSDDLNAAQIALAMEFSSVARPDTNESHFGGAGATKPAVSARQTAQALGAERDKYQHQLEAAWNSLSPGL
jgi:hypothetical protein